MNRVAAIPDGYRSLTPYFCCRDAAMTIDFYRKAFATEEILRIGDPSGKIGHIEMRARR